MAEDEKVCRFCGQRIVRMNYALGPQWEHQPRGSVFMDNIYTSCRLTVATPKED